MIQHPSSEERELRERFARLKGDLEREGAPSFRAMLERARADAAVQAGGAEQADGAAQAHGPPRAAPARDRRRWLRVGGWASVAAAAALAGLLITQQRADANADAEFERLVASFDASAGSWQSPTAALLEVPGSDLMRSMPSVGATVPSLALPEPPDFSEVGDRPGDTL